MIGGIRMEINRQFRLQNWRKQFCCGNQQTHMTEEKVGWLGWKLTNRNQKDRKSDTFSKLGTSKRGQASFLFRDSVRFPRTFPHGNPMQRATQRTPPFFH